jgi:primosomal protein N' (replication factor Y)
MAPFCFGIAKVDKKSYSPNFFLKIFKIIYVPSQNMSKTQYISVILPLKIDWEPYYRTDLTLSVGDRVKVGFAGKEYIAVVSKTECTPDIDTKKVKAIISAEDAMEKVLLEEIELWRQVAQYYMCSIGEVYKAAYPISKLNMEEARAAARQRVVERKKKLVAVIEARLGKLQDRLEKKTALAEKTKDGTKTKATLLADIIKIRKEIESTITTKEAAENAVKTAEKGLTLTSKEIDPEAIVLSAPQQNALKQIKGGFSEKKPVLLHGVTGSGKTEIYIKLATEAILKGQNVLYLVPEIALSRQLEDRLYEIFEDRLLTFHSGESAASRRNSAEIIRNMTSDKGGYIALCTRSGIFLPHHDLGLIIVDEEHDSSYKQDSPAPRYNGRDAALMMSRIHKDCNIILGSATPSLEELYNAASGRHGLVTLSERYHHSEAAEIELIDTKAERKKFGMVGNFSRKLIQHIQTALANNEQVLILRSRRAWATALQCTDCGEIQKCPHCNVSLSHHKNSGRMVCHYCGYSTAYTGKCGKCSGELNNLGAGTQKIEEEAAALFPDARIARLDSDTAQNKAFEAKTIKDFAKGDIDILIGTQIITKGFDFEKLNLVAVIAADTLLGIQDFRADEKAMQLLEQFRGRCGRREKKGMFVIQTSQPEHPIYQSILSSGEQNFSHTLLSERKDFDFPPYTRIIELTVKDTFEDRADRMSRKLSHALDGFTITGPYSPAVDKIADRHIRKIRISLKKDRSLALNKARLDEAVIRFEKSEKYEGHISIDVDPA